MKILRIVYDWPPPWTGLTPQPYEITRAQKQMGDDVTVMSGRWPKAGNLEVPNGVKVITVWRAPIQGTVIFTSALLMFFRYLLWRRKNIPDVIHIHGHFGYWLLVYRNFLHRLKPWHRELEVPVVYHYHITYQGRWEEAKKKGKSIKFSSEKIEWPLMVKADKLGAKIASACVFTSINVKQEAVNYYKVKEEKCFVVESGVNTNLFRDVTRDERDKTRKELGFDPFDKVILNYGFIVERKNIHLLVDSLKFLSNEYKLLLVGPSDVDYEEKLNTIIKDITKDMDNYRFYLAGEKLYQYVWHNFADKIIENSKEKLKSKNKNVVLSKQYILRYVLEKSLIMLHPFVPFVTEEIWSIIKKRNKNDFIMVTTWPSFVRNKSSKKQ